MLCDIVKGKQSSPFILIQDSLLEGGFVLLRAFVHEFLRKEGERTIHVLCFENHPNCVAGSLKLSSNSTNIKFHDFCTDHRGWNSGKEDTCLNLGNWSERLLASGDDKVVFIVDSLSVIISNIGVDKCYQQVHRIIQGWPRVQLIALVHEDFLPKASETILKLRHLATTCVQVKPTDPISERSVVFSTHIKQGGKLTSSVELFIVDKDSNIICQEYKSSDTKAVSSLEIQGKLPQELTTFKLDLGIKEQEARNKVVLPYLRREEGGGKVFYQPDEADDWDEEDPDDDLDI